VRRLISAVARIAVGLQVSASARRRERNQTVSHGANTTGATEQEMQPKDAFQVLSLQSPAPGENSGLRRPEYRHRKNRIGNKMNSRAVYSYGDEERACWSLRIDSGLSG
jgi:hypothetical protein